MGNSHKLSSNIQDFAKKYIKKECLLGLRRQPVRCAFASQGLPWEAARAVHFREESGESLGFRIFYVILNGNFRESETDRAENCFGGKGKDIYPTLSGAGRPAAGFSPGKCKA